MSDKPATEVRASEIASGLNSLGEVEVRRALPSDNVAGVQPLVVAAPSTATGVSAVLKYVQERRLSAVPRGGATQLALGFPPATCDVVLDLHRLHRVIEYNPADMTAIVEAGVTLDALQARLAEEGQWLALDPLLPPAATIGGVVATNASGPRRLRYGGARDQIIGVQVARADGVIAKGGGKVVKNVAGFDLPKLFTGSLGTLGVILNASFRLYPLPESRGAVVLRAATIPPLASLAMAIVASNLTPSAIDLTGSSSSRAAYQLAVRFDGTDGAVSDQLAHTESLTTAEVQVMERLGGEAVDAFWRGAGPRSEPGPETTAHEGWLHVKSAVLPSHVPSWLAEFETACHEWGLSGEWRAHAGHGIIVARLRGSAGQYVEVVDRLRAAARWTGGSLIVTSAPSGLGDLDVWGPSSALALMRRVKQQFDPHGTLNPGRFLGRI